MGIISMILPVYQIIKKAFKWCSIVHISNIVKLQFLKDFGFLLPNEKNVEEREQPGQWGMCLHSGATSEPEPHLALLLGHL